MKAIFNTSPLISLGKLGYLDKIFGIFSDVIIPKAVYEEVMVKNDEVSKKIRELVKTGKIKVLEVNAENIPGLHRGEIEAIVLAKINNCWVVLDDLKARKVARGENVKVIGTLGILRLLKDLGLVEFEPKELFKELTKVGFRIKKELFFEILGEQS
ncbi:DUF3368 domain-containing protein [Pyrococcus kukulkanii]|uniref:DUF3368 domain-containing protein n=2 Tax=Pyrococcus kukulkanii TaxID=1609559 RepID=A0A127B870_9EURY|nr:DUF3368 domain-containing protein [Pyrococcus kukulkanii]AMM53570.1 hypothetical protein TQ32_03050 [Pyrococcus kukulkanii]RLF88758.1 MAG: DUF3368 domain-containing protein [Thermococci archaeon]